MGLFPSSLILYISSWSYNAPGQVLVTSLLFSWLALLLNIIVSPLPVDPGLFSAYILYLPESALTVMLRSVHKEPATELWVWHSGYWGCLYMRFSQQLMGRLPARVQKAFSRNHVPFMPSDILIHLFLHLLPLHSHGVLVLILWVLQERDRFL